MGSSQKRDGKSVGESGRWLEGGDWVTVRASGVDPAWREGQAHAVWVKLPSKTISIHLPVVAQARFSKTKEAGA